MHREAVVGKDDEEEHEVHEEVQEVGDKVEVEDVRPLIVPPPVQPPVHGEDGVLDRRGHNAAGQDHVLESEQQEHRGARLERVRDGVLEERDVQGQKHEHEGAHAQVREARHVGACLNVLHAVAAQPVEDLDEEQRDKHDDELDVELLAEDRHRQARLHDGVLGAVVQPLHLRLAQLAQENRLEQVPKAQRERERQVAHHHGAELGGGQVQHRGKVLLARLHGVIHQPAGHGEAAQHVLGQRHPGVPSRVSSSPSAASALWMR
mmetsp:Transcript_31223/g.78158  ORF Transcript_31223/g.78158 Transcript_31223/m.78158 type:complete len:263 (-) Transcript_31223:239-1027(-)